MNIGKLSTRALLIYFLLAFLISWSGSIITGLPKYIQGEALDLTDALVMFFPMLLGPVIAGIIMMKIRDAGPGLRDLYGRMIRWRVPVKWYVLAVLFPPIVILLTLYIMKPCVEPVYVPTFAPSMLIIGVLAGYFEEIGWMGAAFIGTSRDVGFLWLPHFIAWSAAMTAVRCLIVWVYHNTKSVLLAQLMHASSTGSLGMLVPTLSTHNDIFFYIAYAVFLWIFVLIIVSKGGFQFKERAYRTS